MDILASTAVNMGHVQTVRLSDCLVLLSDCSWLSGMLFPPPLVALTLSSFSSTPHLVKTRTTTWQGRLECSIWSLLQSLAAHHQSLPLTRLPPPAQPRVLPPLHVHHTIDINLHHTTLRTGH